MKTILFEVKSVEQNFIEMQELLANNARDKQARISFASFELLWKVLSPNRLRLLETMTGAGPIGIRELARRAGRDVRAVHADIQTLLANGVIDKTGEGKILFPYDAIHVDFVLKKAA